MTTIENIHLALPAQSALPKYLALADALSDWLRLHRPEAGSRLPSERQLAENCGTTPVTVAKSLNELVRKGILERKAGSGTYVTEQGTSGGMLRIGLVAHEPIDANDYYISGILGAFHRYWSRRGADIINLVRTPEYYESTIREYNLAGLVVLAPQESYAPKIRELVQRQIPLVSIGICYPELPGHSFGTDHRRVCEHAIDYLYGLGHRCIGLVNSFPSESSSAEREDGYRRGMWNARLPLNPEWLIRGSLFESMEARETLRRLLLDPGRPSAILLAGHADILPFYELTRQLGLAIPEDISVIAFDDPAYATQLSPPLTVFAQPVVTIAERAARQLEQLIRRQPLEETPPEAALLIERKSCKIHPNGKED